MATKVVDLGSVRGPQGPQGPQGSAGQSAYQQAVAAGYTGTEAQFYAALVTLKNAPFMPASPVGIWISPNGVGGVINFGDEDDGAAYVFLRETVDDILEIHAKSLRFTNMSTASTNPLPVNQGGTGKTTSLTAADIQAGSFPSGVKAATGTDYGTYRVRNIAAGGSDLTSTSTKPANGAIYLYYA